MPAQTRRGGQSQAAWTWCLNNQLGPGPPVYFGRRSAGRPTAPPLSRSVLPLPSPDAPLPPTGRATGCIVAVLTVQGVKLASPFPAVIGRASIRSEAQTEAQSKRFTQGQQCTALGLKSWSVYFFLSLFIFLFFFNLGQQCTALGM